MIYTLFFNEYREDLQGARRDAYDAHAEQVFARVQEAHPGFIDMKAYVAEDGERVVVVRFRDMEAQNAWRDDAFHQQAQAQGRTDYYESYRIAVCEEVRGHGWQRSGD